MIGAMTEKARAMMVDLRAPLEFWGEEMGTAVYLQRLTPNEGLMKRGGRDGYKAAYKTPYECYMLMASHGIAIRYRTRLYSTTYDDSAVLSVD